VNVKKWPILAAFAFIAVACQDQPVPSAPPPALSARASVVDPALTSALATASPTDQLEVIVNFDESVTTATALSDALLSLGAGVIQFKHLSMLAALATSSQVQSIAALPGVQSLYLNRNLRYLLAQSVPSIHADAVHAMGITGKGVGIAILDSGIDGLYNADVAFPTKTVQNVKVLANLRDLFTFSGSINKVIKKGAELWVENVANTDNSSGHGTHVAGIAAGNGTSSGGKYTGVAPGAKLVGIGTGEVAVIFWVLAGFDYILDHQQAYNIRVVNNSWGSDPAKFNPEDPINEATKEVHDHGITVVFAAGNDGPDENTLNPYSVAPWVIGVAAGCKLGVEDPTKSTVHCPDNVLADFSSRGIPNDPLYHPDLTAPGVHIVSTRASTGFYLASDATHDFDLTSTCAMTITDATKYTCASGTSMASPHIAGVVALMQEAAKNTLTPDQVLSVLQKTATPLSGFAQYQVGAGFVNALNAVKAVKK
jgi:serine protease AprX